MEQNTPNLRARVWNLLRTARAYRGMSVVSCAALAVALGASTPEILTAVLGDMTQTPEGKDAPPIHAKPTGEGMHLQARYDVEA